MTATATLAHPDGHITADGVLTDRFVSVGTPWPGVDLRVRDEDGLDFGQDGPTGGVRCPGAYVNENTIVAWCCERLTSFTKPPSVESPGELLARATAEILERTHQRT